MRAQIRVISSSLIFKIISSLIVIVTIGAIFMFNFNKHRINSYADGELIGTYEGTDYYSTDAVENGTWLGMNWYKVVVESENILFLTGTQTGEVTNGTSYAGYKRKMPYGVYDATYNPTPYVADRVIVNAEINNGFDLFINCSNLKSIEFVKKNSSALVTMKEMFEGCTNLEELDLSILDTSNVKYMDNLFNNCTSLKKLDISTFTFDNLYTGYYYPKFNTTSVHELTVTNNSTDYSWSLGTQFYAATLNTDGDVESISDTSTNTINKNTLTPITLIRGEHECGSDTICDICGYEVPIGTYDGVDYYAIDSVRTGTWLGMNSYAVRNKNNTSEIIYFLTGTQTGSASNSSDSANHYRNAPYTKKHSNHNNTNYEADVLVVNAEITNGKYLFCSCSNLETIIFTKENSPSLTDMFHMFEYCGALKNLDISILDTSNVTNMTSMFNGCNALTVLDLSNLKFDSMTAADKYPQLNLTAIHGLAVTNNNPSLTWNLGNTFYEPVFDTDEEIKKLNKTKITSISPNTSAPISLITCNHTDEDNDNICDMCELSTIEFHVSDDEIYYACMADEHGSWLGMDYYTYLGDDIGNICILTGTQNEVCTDATLAPYGPSSSIKAVRAFDATFISYEKLFENCTNLDHVELLNIAATPACISAKNMFKGCTSLRSLGLANVDFTYLEDATDMFKDTDNIHTLIINNTSETIPISLERKYHVAEINLEEFTLTLGKKISEVPPSSGILTLIDDNHVNEDSDNICDICSYRIDTIGEYDGKIYTLSDTIVKQGTWLGMNYYIMNRKDPVVSGELICFLTGTQTESVSIAEEDATLDNYYKKAPYYQESGDSIRKKVYTAVINATINDANYLFYYALDNNHNETIYFDKNASIVNDSNGEFKFFHTFERSEAITIDMRNLDTSDVKITSMNSMFFFCLAETIIWPENFDCPDVRDIASMYNQANKLRYDDIDLSMFRNAHGIEDVNHMFASAQSITKVDLTDISMESVSSRTNGAYICHYSHIHEITIKNDNTSVQIELGQSNYDHILYDYYRTSVGPDGKLVMNLASHDGKIAKNTLTPVTLVDVNHVDEDHDTYCDICGMQDIVLTYNGKTYHTCIAQSKGKWLGMDYYQFNDGVLFLEGVQDATTITSSLVSTSAPYSDNGYVFNSNTYYAKDIVIDAKLNNLNYLFSGCTKIENITFTENSNLSLVTNMSNAFKGCTKLTNVNFGSLVFDSSINMSNMFNHCESLTSIDLNHFEFDGTNKSNYANMFDSCYLLNEITLTPNFINFTDFTDCQIFGNAVSSGDTLKETTLKIDLESGNFTEDTLKSYLQNYNWALDERVVFNPQEGENFSNKSLPSSEDTSLVADITAPTIYALYNGEGDIEYQWQRYDSTSGSYTDLEGYTSNSLSLAPSLSTVGTYRCKVTNKYQEWYSSDVTLELSNVTVTFHYNGGEEINDTEEVTLDANVTISDALDGISVTKTGYTFNKWSYNEDGTGDVTLTDTITSNIDLYANWTPITYKIHFDGNGNTSGVMADQTFTYDVAQNLNENEFIKKITVVYDANGGTCSSTGLTYDLSFNSWKFNESRSFADKAEINNLTTVNNETLNLTAIWENFYGNIPYPEREGYTFLGWYDAQSGGTKVGSEINMDGITYYTLAFTNSKTIYAHWSVNTNTLTLNANGGSVTPSTMSRTSEEALGSLPTPEKTGYVFNGWFYDDSTFNNAVTSADFITRDTEIFANWTPITYKVKYDGTGCTNYPDVTMNDDTFTYDASGTLSTNLYEKKYTITYVVNGGSTVSNEVVSYTFDHWVDSNDSSKEYSLPFSICNLASNQDDIITLLPVFNDGTFTLPETTRDGFTFGGWYTDSNLTEIYGDNGDTKTPISDLTLYAKWTGDSSNFNVTGYTSTYTYNQTQIKPTLTVKLGDTTLTKDADYEISYITEDDDYTNCGEKTIRITGLGDIQGTKDITYEIVPYEVIVPISDNKSFTRDYDGTKNTYEDDVTYSYSLSDITGEVITLHYDSEFDSKNAGEKKVNYTLKSSGGITSQKGVSISNYDVKISYNGVTKEDSDFNISKFSFDTNNLISEKELTYSVIPQNKSYDGLKDCEIILAITGGIVGDDKVEIASPINGQFEDANAGTNKVVTTSVVTPTLTSTDGSHTNYKVKNISEVNNNLRANITNIESDDSILTISGITTKNYTGYELTCDDMVIKYKPLVGDEITLVKETDYTLRYENNVNATTSASKAKVTITFIKNLFGSIDKEFEINPMTISEDDLEIVKNSGDSYITKERDGDSDVLESLTIKFVNEISAGSKEEIFFKYQSASYSSNLPADDLDITVKDLEIDGDNINNVILPLSSISNYTFTKKDHTFSNAGQIVDTISPVITKIYSKNPDTYGLGQNIVFVIESNEDMTLPTGSKFEFKFNVTGGTRKVTLNGDALGTYKNRYEVTYTVCADDIAKDGISLDEIIITSDSFRDAYGNVVKIEDIDVISIKNDIDSKASFDNTKIDTTGTVVTITRNIEDDETSELNITYTFTFGKELKDGEFTLSDIYVMDGDTKKYGTDYSGMSLSVLTEDTTKPNNTVYYLTVSNSGFIKPGDTDGKDFTIGIDAEACLDILDNKNMAKSNTIKIKRTLNGVIPSIASGSIVKGSQELRFTPHYLSFVSYKLNEDSTYTTHSSSGDMIIKLKDMPLINGVLTLKDVISSNLSDWANSLANTFTYILRNKTHVYEDVMNYAETFDEDNLKLEVKDEEDMTTLGVKPENVTKLKTLDTLPSYISNQIINNKNNLLNPNGPDKLREYIDNLVLVYDLITNPDGFGKLDEPYSSEINYEDLMIDYELLDKEKKEIFKEVSLPHDTTKKVYDALREDYLMYIEGNALRKDIETNTKIDDSADKNAIIETFGAITRTDLDSDDYVEVVINKIIEQDDITNIKNTLEANIPSFGDDNERILQPYDIYLAKKSNGEKINVVDITKPILVKLELPKEYANEILNIYHIDDSNAIEKLDDVRKYIYEDKCLVYFNAKSFSDYIITSSKKSLVISKEGPNNASVSPYGLIPLNVDDTSKTLRILIPNNYKAEVLVNGVSKKIITEVGEQLFTVTDINETTYVIVKFSENETPIPPKPDNDPETKTVVTSITVQIINHNALIEGYSDKTFRPNENITREEVAAIIARGDSNYNEKVDYTKYLDGIKDVKKTSWSANYLGYLVSKKIIVPNSNCINPTKKATRAEVAKMIATYKGYNTNGKVSTFNDANGHWYDPYVAVLEERNIINGYKDHTFKGTNYITRAEFIKVMCEALGRVPDANKITASLVNETTRKFKDVNKSSWYFNYLVEMSYDHSYN